MQFEDEIFGEMGLVAPNDKSYAYVCEAELVTTRCDLGRIKKTGRRCAYEVLIETTRGSLKSHGSLGVAKGATNAPEAPSTVRNGLDIHYTL